VAQLAEERGDGGLGGAVSRFADVIMGAARRAGRGLFWRVEKVQLVLVDNGSLRPASTLSLREVAAELQRDPRLPASWRVHATSARFSDRVDPSDLGGKPAELLSQCLHRLGAAGCTAVILLPYFLGPSTTVTDFCPEQARAARLMWPRLQVRISPPLWCNCPYLERLLPEDRRDRGVDNRLALAVCSSVMEVCAREKLVRPAVLVCDHGTPTQTVHAVREAVTAQVRELLGVLPGSVTSCSMERRDGDAYVIS
jgi:hypothetical protein